MEEEYTRLRVEWMNWGNEGYLDTQSQWSKKWERVNYLLNIVMADMNFKELERMSDAQDYLESKGKLQDSTKLYNRISDRWSKIRSYQQKRYDELSNILEEEKDKEQKRVREKEKEMLDQYDNN